jgi:hypothetical protein
LIKYFIFVKVILRKKLKKIAWSWHGNGGADSVLNMCAGDAWKDKGSWTRGGKK